jgi:hypothetical protein
VVASRYVPVLNWARHIQIAYFGGDDLARWSMERPYANPLAVLSRQLPDSSGDPVRRAEPWGRRGATPRDLPWVTLEHSWQWRALRRLIDTLRDGGSRLTVIIGPLNEHLLSAADVLTYRRLGAAAESDLRARGIASYSPATLPPDLYADLSHPVAEGYAVLSQQLWAMGLR